MSLVRLRGQFRPFYTATPPFPSLTQVTISLSISFSSSSLFRVLFLFFFARFLHSASNSRVPSFTRVIFLVTSFFRALLSFESYFYLISSISSNSGVPPFTRVDLSLYFFLPLPSLFRVLFLSYFEYIFQFWRTSFHPCRSLSLYASPFSLLRLISIFVREFLP